MLYSYENLFIIIFLKLYFNLLMNFVKIRLFILMSSLCDFLNVNWRYFIENMKVIIEINFFYYFLIYNNFYRKIVIF